MTTKIPINVADLRRRLGERRTIEIDVLLPSQVVIASHSDAEASVVGAVVIESIERGVSVLGEVSFAWTGECRRCLEDVRGTADVTIDELYQVEAPDDSELIDLVGEQVDLLPLVRDAVLVGLPLAPLCRDDCSGPDPERYPTLTLEQIEAERAALGPAPDQRWAALDQLQLPEDA